MAKSKARPQNTRPNAPNLHLYARINFLYQSAQLLARPPAPSPTSSVNPAIDPNIGTPLSRFYLSTARTVAKKLVLRLSPGLKRTICKRCDALLIPGTTCTHRIENNSRGGRKPWADVLVVECNACGAVKRFPVGMQAKNGLEWRLWSERPDVVIGGEERKDESEIQRGDSVMEVHQEPEIGQETAERPVHSKLEEPVRSEDIATPIDVTI